MSINQNKKNTHNFNDDRSIVFGLAEHEIHALLHDHKKHHQAEAERQALIQELERILPQNSFPVQTKPGKSLSIKSQSEHEPSPFVLNLQKMIEEKQTKEIDRQRANHRFENLSEKIRSPFHHAPIITNNEPFTESPMAVIEEVELAAVLKPLSEAEIRAQFTTVPILLLPLRWKRTIITFALMAMVLILPIKGFTYYNELNEEKNQIITTSQAGIEALTSGGQALVGQSSDQAAQDFDQAKESFESAKLQLDNLNQYTGSVLQVAPFVKDYFTDAQRLTKIGILASELGTDLTGIFNQFYTEKKDAPLTDKIVVLQTGINEKLLPKVQELNSQLQLIDKNVLPKDYQPKFETLQQNISEIEKSLHEISNLSYTVTDILGHNYKRRYLVVFQNNNELRATGGFLGSLALVDIKNGNIEKIEIPGGGSYDFQGSLKKQVQSPDPLQLINAKWELQDANWFFDFPTSAKQIESFYEDASGRSVDGVIAINATLIEKLLTHTKPITMSGYNKTINGDNFIAETQEAVELEYDKELNKPKQFISDLTPVLLEQLFDQNQTDLLGVIKEIKQGLAEKEIQMYFNNEDIQQKAVDYNWAGETKNAQYDYLALVNTNVAGGKTDLSIKQTINHKSEIQANGDIIDTINITREHTGVKGDTLSGVRNVNFVRIFVPEGAQLISAEGFLPPPAKLFDVPADYLQTDDTLTQSEQDKQIDKDSQTIIYTNNGKTVFGNWTQTDPGEKTVVTLSYKLPLKIKLPERKLFSAALKPTQPQLYSIFYQKQSGVNETKINSQIVLPNNLIPVHEYPETATDNQFNFDQNTDQLHGLIFKWQ